MQYVMLFVVVVDALNRSFVKMAALCNRAAIIFSSRGFFFFFLSFFPRVISAVADWMSFHFK